MHISEESTLCAHERFEFQDVPLWTRADYIRRQLEEMFTLYTDCWSGTSTVQLCSVRVFKGSELFGV